MRRSRSGGARTEVHTSNQTKDVSHTRLYDAQGKPGTIQPSNQQRRDGRSAALADKYTKTKSRMTKLNKVELLANHTTAILHEYQAVGRESAAALPTLPTPFPRPSRRARVGVGPHSNWPAGESTNQVAPSLPPPALGVNHEAGFDPHLHLHSS
jgi:hypothetical protein